jgi:translation initiation factor 2 subunit 2
MKKKKKKSKKVDFSAFEDGQDQEGDDAARDPDDIFAADDEEGAARSSSKAGADAEEGWIGSNRDYTYTEVILAFLSFFLHCWKTLVSLKAFFIYCG